MSRSNNNIIHYYCCGLSLCWLDYSLLELSPLPTSSFHGTITIFLVISMFRYHCHMPHYCVTYSTRPSFLCSCTCFIALYVLSTCTMLFMIHEDINTNVCREAEASWYGNNVKNMEKDFYHLELVTRSMYNFTIRELESRTLRLNFRKDHARFKIV